LAHVYCGQTAGWMKTPLGIEVDLGPGHIVLNGILALRETDTDAPIFSAHVYCGYGRPSQLLLSSCALCRDFRHQKARVPGLSRGVVCVNLRLAVSVAQTCKRQTHDDSYN